VPGGRRRCLHVVGEVDANEGKKMEKSQSLILSSWQGSL
jgi:hypothetical protein